MYCQWAHLRYSLGGACPRPAPPPHPPPLPPAPRPLPAPHPAPFLYPAPGPAPYPAPHPAFYCSIQNACARASWTFNRVVAASYLAPYIARVEKRAMAAIQRAHGAHSEQRFCIPLAVDSLCLDYSDDRTQLLACRAATQYILGRS